MCAWHLLAGTRLGNERLANPRRRLAVPDRALLYYTGLLAQRPHTANGLAAIASPGVAVSHEYADKFIAGVTNDAALTTAAATALEATLGAPAVRQVQGILPAFSEDFGSFQDEVPGVFFFLGVANAARNMLGQRLPYDEIPWFWSDQYDANIQYAGYHTAYDELIVRGRLDGSSYAAFYMNRGLIDAVVGLNNAKDVRRAMPLIKARQPVDPDRLRDEGGDLRLLLDQA